MGAPFGTKMRILKYIHRLNNIWILKHTDLFANILYNLRIGKTLKYRMQIMNIVAHLLEGVPPGHLEVTILVLDIFLKEWLHLPASFQKEVRSVDFLVSAIKEFFKLFGVNIKFIGDVIHFVFENLDCLCIIYIFEYQISVNPEILHRFWGDLFLQVFEVQRQVQVASWAFVDLVLPSGERCAELVPSWAVFDVGVGVGRMRRRIWVRRRSFSIVWSNCLSEFPFQ